jgi:serine/threonine protein kinase
MRCSEEIRVRPSIAGRKPEAPAEGPRSQQAVLSRRPGLTRGCTHPPREGAPQDDVARRLPARQARLGNFHLIAPLACGREGEVWKAVQVEPLVDLVALKLLTPDRQREPGRLARFRSEARQGASLDGPALLPTYEFGVADGIAYIVMPLVDGFSLGDILRQRRSCRAGSPPLALHRLAILPRPRYLLAVVRALTRIARALHAAHAARIVHCDVKPANILLDRNHEHRAFLVDFGLGCDLDDVPLPRWRAWAGTPLYMAPEKLLAGEVDGVLCDIYALGVTLFEALTLTPPRVVPADVPREAWAAYLAGTEPPRPRAVDPAVPAALDAIVARAMARDPRRRYPSASALAADLDRFLACSPAEARRGAI